MVRLLTFNFVLYTIYIIIDNFHNMITIQPLLIIIAIVVMIIVVIVMTYKGGPMSNFKKEGLNVEQSYIVNAVKKLDNIVNSYSY